ncbi:MAG TPA: MBL fold metallo-hydrolase, partial [Candidatus Acetothermia bacterium]|nr:MBL fold metallo-hydrolase [Candidatus Acetothermia bacterium]
MEFRRLVVGPLRTNAYIALADGEGAIIDPGEAVPHLAEACTDQALRY